MAAPQLIWEVVKVRWDFEVAAAGCTAATQTTTCLDVSGSAVICPSRNNTHWRTHVTLLHRLGWLAGSLRLHALQPAVRCMFERVAAVLVVCICAGPQCLHQEEPEPHNLLSRGWKPVQQALLQVQRYAREQQHLPVLVSRVVAAASRQPWP